MGGIALSFWKHPRFTQDVDLLVQLAETEIDALADRLAMSGIMPKRRPPLLNLGPRLEALEDRCLLSFSPATSYAVGVNPQAVVTADFNNDSILDVAVANTG